MNDILSYSPPGAAEFQAPRDFSSPVEVVELDFDKIKHEVADYCGEGFEDVESVENLTLVEYLQRLKADRGRYLGNIIHQGVRDHRGINDKGEEEVIRVIFYSDSDPNQAIEGFYKDLSIDFDQTILGQDEVGSVDYSDVSYRYEYNKLKQKLIELASSSSR